jgi:hypothetical protein
MSFYDAIRVGASGAADFEVERSLRFSKDDDTNLARTPSSAGNRKVWTWSAWVKRGKLGLNTATLFHAYDGSSSNRGVFNFQSDDTLNIDQGGGSGSNKGQAESTMVFRDVSAWYHIVIRANYSDSTASDRIKLYVNGTQQTLTFDVAFVDEDGQINGTFAHQIGEHGGGNYFDGYMAEVNFIDGQALTPSSFAETNTETGQWIPKNTSGLTFGTNGFRLQFLDNSGTSATTLGKDTSGNSNNYTPNNFSVSAGINNDSLTDTPTNNFCTLNFLDRSGSADPRNGLLTLFTDANDQGITGTFAVSSGKWYWEVDKNDAEPEIGIAHHNMPLSNKSVSLPSDGQIAFIVSGADSNTNFLRVNGSTTTGTGMSAQTGTGSIGIALDMDNKKIWWSDLSGNYFNSGNPATGSNAQVDFSSTGEYANDVVTPFVSMYQGSNKTVSINFGQRPFTHTQPTGFQTLCSANLPDPTILLPNKHFDTFLYSATGNAMSFSGLNFQPDWIWQKRRDNVGSSHFHYLFDAVRGGRLGLQSNTTGAEFTGPDPNITFTSNGYDMAASTGGQGNGSGGSYVSWNWNAGGSTVTNNDGSISSQVRANTTAGFSIVSYTGTGSTATVGHGLGVAPDVLIVKNRDDTNSWNVYHVGNAGSTPAEDFVIYLNQTSVKVNQSSNWNDTAPTSSVFTVGSSNGSNGSSDDMIAYCFSEVAGYSKFGFYTGNGNANGPLVFLGFRPAFVLTKIVDTMNENWTISDNKRSTFNAVDAFLRPDESTAETSGAAKMDFLSNGFKLRNTDDKTNRNGGKFIFMAFAESPFKNSRAR